MDPTKFERFAKYILSECAVADRVTRMDNRELLWWMLQSPMLDDRPDDGFFARIISEIEDRLYPEYDGDTVRITDWGWETPEGPIIYIPTDAPDGR